MQIPHVIRPEVQHVKLLIETFVPRGKKAKVAHPVQIPTLENKLSDNEIDLLAKYFNSSGESLSKPSLIAYRHFQAFPSRVHRVSHSFRTEMLIDAMQHLEGLAFSSYAKASSEVCSGSLINLLICRRMLLLFLTFLMPQVETPGNLCMRVEAAETYENGEEGKPIPKLTAFRSLYTIKKVPCSHIFMEYDLVCVARKICACKSFKFLNLLIHCFDLLLLSQKES